MRFLESVSKNYFEGEAKSVMNVSEIVMSYAPHADFPQVHADRLPHEIGSHP